MIKVCKCEINWFVVDMNQRDSGNLLDVLKKHVEQERELETKIQKCEESRQQLRSRVGATTIKDDLSAPSLRQKREAARARNQQLLKNLEKSKAILRTESTFTPSEQELRDLAAAYRGFSSK